MRELLVRVVGIVRNMVCAPAKIKPMRPLKYIIRRFLLTICVGCLLYIPVQSQQIGFDFPEGIQHVEIPFERYNNLIVIPVTINNAITLKFILDTGVQFAILTEKAFGDFMELKYDRRLVIQGPGSVDSVSAQVASRVKMKLPGGITSGINQSLLVLEKDYLDLRKNLGADVYGIIGYDIFSRFVVEINHDNSRLILHEPRYFKPKKYYKRVPMQVVATKPYISARLGMDNGSIVQMNLMVDTGASHALLLDDESEHVILPSKTLKTIIGRGLGGDIDGLLGRVNNVQIGKFNFNNPIASFPKAGSYGTSMKRGSRHGTIGGEILTRFNPIFDYLNGVLYLRKSGQFYKEFEHDMSGLAVVAGGLKLDEIKVVGVREDSPASEAGLQVNDIITSINGLSTKESDFSLVTTLLRAKPGKRLLIRFVRNGESAKTSFKLKRMI